MSEMTRVADQLKRAFEGPAWHGPAVLEVLENVTAEQAARRPIPDAHSIWEIVLHITTWEDVVRRRALGEAVEVSEAENWPAVTSADEKAWDEAKARLAAGHHALREVLASLPEARLEEALVPGGSTGYVQIHGAVQHDLYHAGQIAVLKKAKKSAGAKAAGRPAKRARRPARAAKGKSKAKSKARTKAKAARRSPGKARRKGRRGR